MAGHVARMEEGRSAFKILKDKPTERRLLGSLDGRTITCVTRRNWIDSAQHRDYCRALGNEALNLRVA